jgi:hypothetical protein
MRASTELQRIAKSRGGKLLGRSSTESRKYLWQCAQGHCWAAGLRSVKAGTWCRRCAADGHKARIEAMQLLARARGGVCLSTAYRNASSKLRWKCQRGHIFRTSPSRVKRGRWCPICGAEQAAKKRRTPMSVIQELAKARGGRCLSKEYRPPAKLTWECALGHVWRANFHSVKRGSWCGKCFELRKTRTKISMNQIAALARSRGGRCLSTEYATGGGNLEWRCACGHQWHASPYTIRRGHWCPKCAGNLKKDITAAQELANARGGACLSRVMKNTGSTLKWRCAEGHIWRAKYGNVRSGRWCPECSSGLGERVCRAIFESVFKEKFPRLWPEWLVNGDGHRMQLDGFCEKLSLAFEHHGLQHYEFRGYFHSKAGFRKRLRDDREKRRICRKQGVALVEIPQVGAKLQLEQVQAHILRQLRKHGVKYPARFDTEQADLWPAFGSGGQQRLAGLKGIAEARGGKCLSRRFMGMGARLKFRCRLGHEWATVPSVIIKGHWCPRCAAANRGLARRLTLDEMQKIARSRGGECLSGKYINANSPLRWRCHDGHVWRAIPNSIKRGSWCQKCSRRRAG